jgi:hypothetical protein
MIETSRKDSLLFFQYEKGNTVINVDRIETVQVNPLTGKVIVGVKRYGKDTEVTIDTKCYDDIVKVVTFIQSQVSMDVVDPDPLDIFSSLEV